MCLAHGLWMCPSSRTVILELGSPRSLLADLLLYSGQIERNAFSSVLFFPFLSLSPGTAVSPQRVLGPSSCSMYDWEDSHSLPSPTTSSATTPLALQLPPRSNPPIFKRTDGMIPQVSWCAVQNYLCLVMDVQIVVNQRREKKE